MRFILGVILKKVLKLDSSDNCRTLWIYQKPMSCALWKGNLYGIWVLASKLASYLFKRSREDERKAATVLLYLRLDLPIIAWVSITTKQSLLCSFPDHVQPKHCIFITKHIHDLLCLKNVMSKKIKLTISQKQLLNKKYS